MTRDALEKKLDFLKKDHEWVADFFKFPTGDLERMMRTKDESFWRDLGERRALSIFKNAAKRVPAYNDFLRKHHITAGSIKNSRDFANVPVTTKENYVEQYPLAARAWDGDLSKNTLIAASSGTTGDPKYWPRSGFQEFEAAITHELIYRAFFNADKKKTLFIIGFPMGIYVSGVATLLPTWLAANKFPGASIMSIGNNKQEIIRAVRNVSGDYDQVILIGHPFFIKDIIETGKEQGLTWKKTSVRLLFCSEGVSEAWREYVMREAGCDPNDLRVVVSTYGSSEFLLMGYETPLSIGFRKTLPKAGTVPDVFQYNPLSRFIESERGELIFTVASGVPLIRYNLRDAGRVLSFREVAAHVASQNRVVRHNAGPASSWWKLPFVTLSGRSDQAIVFYAANIYPEHIKGGLNASVFFGKLTGRFTMRKDYSKNMDEFLEVNIELRPNVKATRSLASNLRDAIVHYLETANMEYKFLRNNLDKNIVPRIKLRPYGYAKYFKQGLKPRYIVKN